MRFVKASLALLTLIGAAEQVLAQGEDVPRIKQVTFERKAFIGTGYNEGYLSPAVVFIPFTEVATEGDEIDIRLIVSDRDLGEREGNEPITFFYRLNAAPAFGVPPPPLGGDTNGRYVPAEWEPQPPDANDALIIITLTVPPFQGPSQFRERGFVDFDTGWLIDLRVANDEDPAEGQYDLYEFGLFAIENEGISSSNPPPDADAGSDTTVRVGSIVRLDGSRTFDGSNVGFAPGDQNVFTKDTLRYTWEWVSGPERADPRPYDPTRPFNSPYALVTLNSLTTPTTPYVYRLLVDDGVNPVPSESVVRIFVVASLPANRGPTAVADVPDAPVTLGTRATLNGSLSNDPDGDMLTFVWKQTNAVGGELTEDELLDGGFQPLQGSNTAVASFVPFTTGRYYFSLTVIDPEGLSDNVLVFVDAVAADGSTAADRDAVGSGRSGDAGGLEGPNSSPAAGCGAGLLSAALLPLLLLGMRR